MFRETNNIMVFGKFPRYWEQKLIIFVDVLLEKTAHEHTKIPYEKIMEDLIKLCTVRSK